MAKKKSKVGKQKQNKAKSLTKKRKQISSKYNVPFTTNNGIRTPGGINTATSKANQSCVSRIKTPHNSPMNTLTGSSNARDGNNKKRITMLNEKKLPRNNARGVRERMIKHSGTTGTEQITNKSTGGNTRNPKDTEAQDYIQEFKSLQERTLRQQQVQKEQQQNTSSTFHNFTQPTFIINQKPNTDELILQAASQLNQQQLVNHDANGNNNNSSTSNALNFNHNLNSSMNGTNNEQQQQQHNNYNSTLLQTLAAEKRKEQRMASLYYPNSNNNDKTDKDIMKQNSFWALQDDDDDDDDEKKNASNITSYNSQFNFSAPSFVVPAPLNGIHNGNGYFKAVGGEDDDDDDL